MPEVITSLIGWLDAPWPVGVAALFATLGAAGLGIGATWTVDGAVAVANRIRMSPRMVGLTIVAVGTSAPEFAVTLNAAMAGSSDLAISNVVGSNIFNLGFILGGVVLVKPIATDRWLVWRDGAVLLLSSLAVWLLFGLDLGVERSNGALLMLGLVAYLTLLLGRWSTQEKTEESSEVEGSNGSRRPGLTLIGGVVLIALGAELMVEAAASIAVSFGVSEWVVGVTIVAAGTSLPEFTTSLVAVLKGHHGLSIGNVIGSDIFNVLGVLGLTALIQPVSIRPEASGSLLALVGMVALVVIFMRTGWRLTRVEGGLLVCLGVLRWVLDFL